MRKAWVLLAVSSLLVSAVALAADKPANAEAEAQKAAESWLALVDGGKTGESWEQSASLFRGAVTKEGWASAVQTVRGPLGKLRSRRLRATTYATTLPGAPDGHYVVIEYDAVYDHKAAAVETITPMLDKDGRWRVSGYFIR